MKKTLKYILTIFTFLAVFIIAGCGKSNLESTKNGKNDAETEADATMASPTASPEPTLTSDETTYLKAKEQYESGKYEEALSALNSISDHTIFADYQTLLHDIHLKRKYSKLGRKIPKASRNSVKKIYMQPEKIERILKKFCYHTFYYYEYDYGELLDNTYKITMTDRTIHKKEYGIAYMYTIENERDSYYIGYYYFSNPKKIYKMQAVTGSLFNEKTGKLRSDAYELSCEYKLGRENKPAKYGWFSYSNYPAKQRDREYNAYINSLGDWSEPDKPEKNDNDSANSNNSNNGSGHNSSGAGSEELSDDEMYSIGLELWDAACQKVGRNCQYISNYKISKVAGYAVTYKVFIADQNSYRYFTIRFSYNAFDGTAKLLGANI